MYYVILYYVYNTVIYKKIEPNYFIVGEVLFFEIIFFYLWVGKDIL